MIRKTTLVFMILFIVASCKKDTKISNDTFEESLVNEAFGVKESDDDTFEYESYLEECNVVIEKHKQRMRATLPSLIAKQVDLYKNLLDENAISKLTSLTDKEFDETTEKRKKEVLDKLMESEISINIEYLDLLNELNFVNEKYKTSTANNKLLSFYEVPHIILSDEVLFKIQEVVADEISFNKKEKKEGTVSVLIYGAITIMHFIPIPQVKPVAIGLGVLNELYEKEVGDKIAPEKKAKGFTTESTKQDIIKEMREEMLKENIILEPVKDKSKVAMKKEFLDLTIDKMNEFDENDIDYEKAFQTFHIISNKIEGRIGDFSDGILAVYLQNVREKVKENNVIILRGN